MTCRQTALDKLMRRPSATIDSPENMDRDTDETARSFCATKVVLGLSIAETLVLVSFLYTNFYCFC